MAFCYRIYKGSEAIDDPKPVVEVNNLRVRIELTS